MIINGAHHRNRGAVSVRPADRQASGTGPVRGVERESTTAGAYHEARQLSTAIPVAAGTEIANVAITSPSGNTYCAIQHRCAP